MPKDRQDAYLQRVFGTLTLDSRSPRPDIPSTYDRIIAVIGRTGSRKSLFIAHLAINNYSEVIRHKLKPGRFALRYSIRLIK